MSPLGEACMHPFFGGKHTCTLLEGTPFLEGMYGTRLGGGLLCSPFFVRKQPACTLLGAGTHASFMGEPQGDVMHGPHFGGGLPVLFLEKKQHACTFWEERHPSTRFGGHATFLG